MSDLDVPDIGRLRLSSSFGKQSSLEIIEHEDDIDSKE